jgi:hypothetical protein
MAALSVNVKRYIVQALACFDTPNQVSKAVKDEFGLDVPRSQIQRYDPTKSHGQDLSGPLRTLFEETRAKFRSDVEAIPIANQTYRLNSLNRMLLIAESKSDAALAASLMEQAAKEVGGAYTNTRRLEGGDPKKPVRVTTAHELSDAELAVIAASGGA